MGKAIARRFLKKGYEVLGWNRTRKKAEELVTEGLIILDSPAAIGEQADIIFLAVADSPAVEAVLFSKNGLLKSLKEGTIVINISTIMPGDAIRFHKAIKERDAYYIDCPVLGSPRDIERGKLIILFGGDQNLLSKVRSLLEDLGEKIFYMGDVGKASAMKLIFNMVSPSLVILLGEAINMGIKAGLDVDKVVEVLLEGPLRSAIERYYNKIMNPNPPVTFTLRLMVKDLEYANRFAYELGMPLFIPAIVKNIYSIALANGFGDEYHARVYKVLKRISGLE